MIAARSSTVERKSPRSSRRRVSAEKNVLDALSPEPVPAEGICGPARLLYPASAQALVTGLGGNATHPDMGPRGTDL